MRYIVQFTYKSERAEWQPGQIVELPEDEAAWFNRDAKGVLALIVEAPPEPVVEEHAVEQPPHDRMVRRAARRGKR